jgi:hypothetical protein
VTPPLCPGCRMGEVVLRAAFFDYWLERFPLAEIREIGEGDLGLK